MKKILSILSIAVRSSLYKVFLIIIGMGALQLGLFYHTYNKYEYPLSGMEGLGAKEIENLSPGNSYGITWTLESLVDRSRVEILFLAAFVFICMVLAWSQAERKGVKSYYFYERLSVDVSKRFTAWTIYNVCCMLLLVFGEFLAVLGMGYLFEYLAPQEYGSVQMYFMAFYKSDFLHSLIPMAEVLKWLRNGVLFTACGMEIAGYACRRRKPWGLFVLMVLFVFGFSQGIAAYGMDILQLFVALVYIAVNVRRGMVCEGGNT